MQGKTEFLIVGETDPNGLTQSYLRGFRDAGIRAECFDYYKAVDALPRPKGPFPSVTEKAGRALARPFVEFALHAKVELLRPRAVLFLKCDDIHRTLYRALKASPGHPIVAAFHPDDPFRIRRPWRRGPSHPRALAQMRLADHYYLWAKHLVERARDAGANAEYLAFGADPHIHRPVQLDANERELYGADVGFVGNHDAKRERWLAAFEGSGLKVAIWGERYWADRCQSAYVRSCWRGQAAHGVLLSKLMAAMKVSLNVLREQNEGGHNMRTFETPASAGVMLAEWSEDQAGHFTPDREAVYARSPEDMVTQAVALCRAPDARLLAIREAAYEKSKLNTYAVRARDLATRLGI